MKDRSDINKADEVRIFAALAEFCSQHRWAKYSARIADGALVLAHGGAQRWISLIQLKYAYDPIGLLEVEMAAARTKRKGEG